MIAARAKGSQRIRSNSERGTGRVSAGGTWRIGTQKFATLVP